jgi:hypothetical protein
MLLTLLQLNLQSSAQYQAYWIAHAAASWPGVPTGAQIKAGNLSNSSPASYSGSELVTDSSTGTRTIDEVTAITGLSANTAYTLAWVVWDSVADTYSNVVVGDVTTDAAGVTGTLAVTNANDTSAASGTTTIVGTLARTNANDAVSASGTTTVVGTLARTNANDSVAASGSVGGAVTGTVAYTNANDTSAASGTTTVTGTVAQTNANDSVSASGTTTVIGTVARTNANDSVAASGAAGSVTGTVAVTNANDSVSASGTAGGLQDTHDGFWRKQWKKIREREKKKIHAELIEEIEEIEEQIEEVKAVQVVAAKAIAKAQYMPDYSEQARIIAALIARRQELIEQEDEELLLLL